MLQEVQLTMSKSSKVLEKILSGTADANIRFDELCVLLENLEFEHRIRGSHHIFNRDQVEEILNLQPRGSLAKPYQVKQLRNVFVKYQLELK